MSNWTEFRNFCSYCIDCVKYSEKSQEYLFPNQLNTNFMLPALGYDWLQKEEFDIPTTQEQRYIRTALLTAEESDELFIGYPLSSFISTGGAHCLSPVMLFPVTVSTLGQGLTTGLRITIDRRGIEINKAWLEFHVPRDQHPRFARACENSLNGMNLDVENVLSFISAHFRKNEAIDSNRLSLKLSPPEGKSDNLLNTAVLFIGSSTKYTRTLIKELTQIRVEPDEVLDQTALAHVFRNPPLEIKEASDEEKKVPVLFTKNPLNDGQYRAIEEALNHPVSKVTGPPGTGKSHMSVNLIENEVFNGGSVLFTSKNHKAIHAVYEMCQDNKPREGFDFVSFCTIPGNDSVCQWDKMYDEIEKKRDLVTDYLNKSGRTNLPKNNDQIPFPALDSINHAQGMFRDANAYVKKYDVFRKKLSHFEQLMVETEKSLSALSGIPVSELQKKLQKLAEFLKTLDWERFQTDDEWLRKLAKCLELLKKEESTSETDSAWIRLMLWVRRFVFFRKRPDVIKQLKAIAPGLAAAYSKPSTIKKNARRLLRTIKFREKLEEFRKTEMEVIRQEESECNYEELETSLLQALKTIQACSKDAFVDFLCQKVNDMADGSLLDKMKDAVDGLVAPLPFMTQNPMKGKYDEALRLFGAFHKIFPAWGVTLLSLRKASPCLPGVFSLVLIDEASQCEIPPMIPALFRAKRVAVVGDTKQFPPVITMKKKLDEKLCKVHGVERKFMFSENNVFSVIPRSGAEIIELSEHFRCTDEIAMYCNEEFYKGKLCPSVGDRNNQGYDAYGLKPGMDFIDARDGDEAEIDCAIEYLKKLRKNGFKGTVGVISPLRKLANEMKTVCFRQAQALPVGLTDERINTANGFQGGQCDIIVFLLGLNENRKNGEEWYITDKDNKYIFNVSVSRAKVCFVAIGNKDRAENSGLSHIQKLIPGERIPKNVKIGPGEKRLQEALTNAGIETIAQYPVLGRYLDLAIVDEARNLKIDIEVDGQAYHLDRNGCRKNDDIHRDLLMATNGWKVLRFWHYEVIEHTAACVKKVREAIGKCSKERDAGRKRGVCGAGCDGSVR
ncbi:MAG: AAA domain-containing protein [Kiritimatiellia bacterium]